MFDFSRPELRVFANSDFEMQRFESCRPRLTVNKITVYGAETDGALLGGPPLRAAGGCRRSQDAASASRAL
jgi:hypothetical protein